MAWAVSPDVERYDEAVDHFLSRVVMTGDEARDLDDRAKAQAFWIGGGLQLDQIQRVFDKSSKALEAGEPFDEWRARVRGELKNDAHAETVFRNLAQNAYNTGRWRQMTEPSVLRFRPYGMVDAILDGRTTEYCRSVDGTVLPLEDAWWDTHYFPAHHRCRTSVRNLRKSEAERRGITATPPEASPAPGFGLSPRVNAAPWKPDPAKYDPQLAFDFAKKAEVPLVRTGTKDEHTPEFWEKHYSNQYGEAASTVGWGRASLERGLDLTARDARKHLERLRGIPSVDEMLADLDGIDGDQSLRNHAGELDPLRRASAALAGHLAEVAPRKLLPIPGLTNGPDGKRARKFFFETTAETVEHPTDWDFRLSKARAYANASGKEISFRSVPGVLEHEWSHALESLNPTALKKATAFLQARTKGEKLQRLRDLYPRSRYRLDEVARRDGFLTPYIGKDYSRLGVVRATEVTSMGIELLVARATNWGTLDEMVRTDLEHLLFVLGQLAGK